jgi:protocatechuate 3,4-dioxygenase beta subunit
MTMDTGQPTTRRALILTASSLATGIGLARAGDAFAQELAPTPACHDGDEPTARQTEGPFYKLKSPERADLTEPGAAGRPVELSGFVLTRRCRPVARVLVDLWHADEKGDYDNAGFRYRGHQFTDADGRFRFRTIQPPAYSGRTRHYHVIVQSTGRRLLTTQLYFPNEPGNQRDGLYRRELLMRMAQAGDRLSARFDFVLDMR